MKTKTVKCHDENLAFVVASQKRKKYWQKSARKKQLVWKGENQLKALYGFRLLNNETFE